MLAKRWAGSRFALINALLKETPTLKANAGSAIKRKIEQVLVLLSGAEVQY